MPGIDFFLINTASTGTSELLAFLRIWQAPSGYEAQQQ